MAKLTVRNDSGSTIYLEDFGHQELLNGNQVMLKGSRNRFIDSTQLQTLIDDSDLVVVDERGDDMNTYQGQHLRVGPTDDEIQEQASLRVVIYGKADVGSPDLTLTKGTPVHISNYDTENDEYTFVVADSDTASFPAIGVVNGDTITATQGGHVVIVGRIARFDTSSWTGGDALYVSSTGTLTNTKPTGVINKVQKTAEVLHSHATEGVIMVIGSGRANDVPNITSGKVWMGNGSDVATETDVYTETETDSLLSGKSSTSHTHTFYDLTDTALTSPAKGSVLVYDGFSDWNDMPIGTDGEVLTASSSHDIGVTWSTITHDGLSGFVSNEHVNHSTITLTAGAGLSGGGNITSNRSFSVNVQNSIEIDTDTLQLVGDAASPGNNKVYGTNGSGVKGWKDDPAGGGGGDVTAAANLNANALVVGDDGVKGVVDMDWWTVQGNGAMSAIVSTIADGTPVLMLRHNGASSRSFLEMKNSSGHDLFDFRMDTDQHPVLKVKDGNNYPFVIDDGSVKIGETSNFTDNTYALLIDDGVLGIRNSSGNTVGFSAPASLTTYTLTLPIGYATANGQILSSTTGGALSWIDPPAGGGSPQGAATTLGELTDVDLTGSPAPASGDVLSYSGSSWEHNTIESGATSKQMDSWTNLSGNLYYNDFAHNLNTTEFTIFLYDTVTDKEVRPEYTEIIDADTVRVVVNGNSEDLTVNVVSGRGPAGPIGPTGAAGGGLTDVINDTTPQLGGDLDTNNKNISFTPPTVDDTASGIIVTATVDTVANGVGTPLYMASDGNFDSADADAATTMPCRALAVETGTGSKKVLLQGFLRNNTWAFTAGGDVYVSTTIGTVTQTAPSGTGDQVQKIGFAWDADTIYFNPGDYTVVEVA